LSNSTELESSNQFSKSIAEAGKMAWRTLLKLKQQNDILATPVCLVAKGAILSVGVVIFIVFYVYIS